jgi:sortase A
VAASRLVGAALVLFGLVACSSPAASPPPAANPGAIASTAASGPPTPTVPRPEPPAIQPAITAHADTFVFGSDGRPQASRLSIPSLGLDGLRVRPYRGSPDDARGTAIQDGGIAASPYGSRGGVGPGGIGNHIVTAHRTSSTRAFARLPRLRNGAKVHLVADGKRYTYRIVATRKTSFRSERSLAQQSAAVPGRPGVKPTRAMITLSTCRTPEDRAEGNFWSDRFNNPEHRIDKIGELIAIQSV